MGLDVSHGCFSGPYGQFMRWRTWLAKHIGIPLGLMDGFYKWEWDWRDGRGTYDGYVPATKRLIRGMLNAYKSREKVTFG